MILILAVGALAGVASKPAHAEVRFGVYLGGPPVVAVPVVPRYVDPYYSPYYDPYYAYPPPVYTYRYRVPAPRYYVAPRYRGYERRDWGYRNPGRYDTRYRDRRGWRM